MSKFLTPIFSISFVIIMFGCTTIQAEEILKKQNGYSCAGADVTENIKISKLPNDQFSSILISENEEGGALNIKSVHQISGDCNKEIAKFAFGIFALSDGRYLRLKSDQDKLVLEILDKNASTLFDEELSRDDAGKVKSYSNLEFQNGTRFGPFGYIGIWNGIERSILSAIGNPNEQPLHHEILLESSLPFYGYASYFGAVDAQIGNIYLMQKGTDNTLFLITLDWDHRGLFQS